MKTEHSPLRPTDIKMLEGLVKGAFYEGVSSGMDEHRKFNGGKSWDETKAFKNLETLRAIFIKAVNRDSAFDDLVKALEYCQNILATIISENARRTPEFEIICTSCDLAESKAHVALKLARGE